MLVCSLPVGCSCGIEELKRRYHFHVVFCSIKQKHWRMVRVSFLLVNNSTISSAVLPFCVHQSELCKLWFRFYCKAKLFCCFKDMPWYRHSLAKFLQLFLASERSMTCPATEEWLRHSLVLEGCFDSALSLCEWTAQRRFYMAECIVNSVTSGYHPLKQHPHHFSLEMIWDKILNYLEYRWERELIPCCIREK